MGEGSRRIYNISVRDGKGPEMRRIVKTPENIQVFSECTDAFGNLYFHETQLIQRSSNEELYEVIAAILHYMPEAK